MEVIDVVDTGIPGPAGTVTPEAQAALAAGVAARDAAVAARDQAQVFSATTVALQQDAVAGVLNTPGTGRTAFDTLVDTRVIVRYAAGQPNRPNLIFGGLQNGSDILAGTIHAVLGQPGGPGYNNIIGGDGTLTVRTATPNAIDPTIVNVGVSNIFGYDNVVGSISGKINSDHSYTEKGGDGHNAIFGGQGHVIRAGGRYAFIAGGDRNDIGGEYAFATGLLNVINGSGSFGAGKLNTVSAAAAAAVVFGTENTLAGIFSYANGYRNKVDGTGGGAEGANAYSRSAFQRVLAGGRNVVDGDAQTSVCAYRMVTTDAVSKALIAAYTGAGVGSQFVVQPGQSVKFLAEVVGRVAGGDTIIAVDIRGLAQRPAVGNAVIVGAPTTTVIYQPDVAITATMAINAAAGHLSVLVKGAAATEIRWSARLTTVEAMA